MTLEITDKVLRNYATGKVSSDLYAEIVELQNQLDNLKEACKRESKKEVIISSIIKSFNDVENELKRFTDDTDSVSDIENALLLKVLEQLEDL